MTYFVYMLASRRNGTLYCGVTNNLEQRVWEHKNGIVGGFTSKYAVNRLVWFDCHFDVNEAIAHEKRLKRWHRPWKIALIEGKNPDWRDLYHDLISAEEYKPGTTNAQPETVISGERSETRDPGHRA